MFWASSVAQHLADDPALLALQVSRRLPLNIRAAAGRALLTLGQRAPRGTAAAALGASMAGDLAQGESLLENDPQSIPASTVKWRCWLKREDLPAADSPASTRARAAWARGTLPGPSGFWRPRASAMAHRRGDSGANVDSWKRATLRVADVPRIVQTGPARRTSGSCTSSRTLCHTQSGYSLRTHNILVGLRDHGIESLALTRTGYPVMVGKPWCADEDVVDGIRYRRTLPRRLGSTPEARLDQEVDEALRVIPRLSARTFCMPRRLSQCFGCTGGQCRDGGSLGVRGARSHGE